MTNKEKTRRNFLVLASTAIAGALTVPLQAYDVQTTRLEIPVSGYLRSGMTGDDALRAAAKDAIASSKALLIDVPVSFAQKWQPPNGLEVRGDRSGNAVLKWRGRGDAIEICGPTYLNGITVDGGATLTDERASEKQSSLVSIHGSVAANARYLSGVRIGWLRIQRTRKVGLVIANVQGLKAETIVLKDIHCAGLMLSGIRDGVFEQVSADNIGDLAKTGSRRGAAVCVFTETKPVADWYDSGVILPTENLSFGDVQIHNTTDSAFYIHDDRRTGVRDIQIERLSVDTAGKDGFKTRNGPVNVNVGKIETRRTALRGVDIESDKVTIDNAYVSEAGFDAIGKMLGRNARYSGGTAENESIQTDPAGLAILNCQEVTVRSLKVENVSCNPATRAEGHGLRILRASGINVTGSIERCDGNGVRISGARDFTIAVEVADACRGGVQKQAILITPDNAGATENGRISGTVRQRANGGAQYAIHVSEPVRNVVTDVKYEILHTAQ